MFAKPGQGAASTLSRPAWLDRTIQAFYAIFFRATLAPRHLERVVRILSFPSLIVAILALTGCHLIDQTDFRNPPPSAKAPPPVPNPDPRPALVTIDFAKADPDYAAALAGAIRLVEQRRPGTLYDVVSVVGLPADAEVGRDRAADVMTGIEAQGVSPARIQLGQRIEPGRKTQQVRVYLR